MIRYIALLKGINVSGHKKIPMIELRQLLNDSGFKNVQTYIQSGNVILDSALKDTSKLEQKIQKAIMASFGFDVSVIVKTPEQLQMIFDKCPFSQEKKEKAYFTMLNSVPSKELVEEASQKKYPGEEFVILDDCIYLYADLGYGQAKYSNAYFERKLKTAATARNYKTMMKLLSLSTEK